MVLGSVDLVKGYSYWTFSDIFEEGGMPSAAFHGGFGLLTIQGIPKASYRAFELLHRLGESVYETRLSHGTVDVYAVRKTASNALQLMIVNHNSLLHPIETETVSIRVTNLPESAGTVLQTETERIDDTHANPLRNWQEMGSPEYLTTAQTEKLRSSSELVREINRIAVHGGKADISIELPPMGMALVTIYL